MLCPYYCVYETVYETAVTAWFTSKTQCDSVNIGRHIDAGARLQHTLDRFKPVSMSQSSFLLSCRDLGLSLHFLCVYNTGSDLACSIVLCNVLCMWVSSAALCQVFVRASCKQPAACLCATITVCFAELFLDVMLLCFVLQQLKIHTFLAGHGLKIRSVLFLIRVCKCYCVV